MFSKVHHDENISLTPDLTLSLVKKDLVEEY